MDVYRVKTKEFGYLCFDDKGWLLSTPDQAQATQFRDGWTNDKMFVQVASGKWKSDYVGGDWTRGIGAWKWKNCGYMKWNDGRLQSQSGLTSGHYIVYRRSKRYFYFYHSDNNDYIETPCIKVRLC